MVWEWQFQTRSRVASEIWNIQGEICPSRRSGGKVGDGEVYQAEHLTHLSNLAIRSEWKEFQPPAARGKALVLSASRPPWKCVSPGGRVTGDGSWEASDQPPCPRSEEGEEEEEEVEEGGFHLEQLPTTYTNKPAIMGAQWERRRRGMGWGRERPHHGKYVMLGERGSWQVSTVSQTITYSLFCMCVSFHTFFKKGPKKYSKIKCQQ